MLDEKHLIMDDISTLDANSRPESLIGVRVKYIKWW